MPSTSLGKNNKNNLILARQITECYLLLKDNRLEEALEYLSVSMVECPEHCMAIDYLLEAIIHIKKNTKEDNNSNNSAVLQGNNLIIFFNNC